MKARPVDQFVQAICNDPNYRSDFQDFRERHSGLSEIEIVELFAFRKCGVRFVREELIESIYENSSDWPKD